MREQELERPRRRLPQCAPRIVAKAIGIVNADHPEPAAAVAQLLRFVDQNRRARLPPAGNVTIEAVRPVVSIANQGDKLVTLLCLRAAALDQDGTPRHEWTEVVATPLAIDNSWRGPLMPGATRHVVMCDWRGIRPEAGSGLRAVCEISELRVWSGQAETKLAQADSD